MSKTICYVEDDEGNRRSTILYLTMAGYTVIDCINTDEGYQSYLVEKPDLMLLDISMPAPYMSGIELGALIRNGNSTAGIAGNALIPIIYFTNASDDETEIAASESQGNRFVPKTRDRKILLSYIHSELEIAEHRKDALRQDLINDFATFVATKTIVTQPKTAPITQVSEAKSPNTTQFVMDCFTIVRDSKTGKPCVYVTLHPARLEWITETQFLFLKKLKEAGNTGITKRELEHHLCVSNLYNVVSTIRRTMTALAEECNLSVSGKDVILSCDVSGETKGYMTKGYKYFS